MDESIITLLLILISFLGWKVFSLERRLENCEDHINVLFKGCNIFADKFKELLEKWNSLVKMLSETEEMSMEEVFGKALDKYEDSVKEYFRLKEKNIKDKNIKDKNIDEKTE